MLEKKEKSQEIDINVETVDPLSLPYLPFSLKRELPNCSAVYFVLSEDGGVLYIGSAKKLFARWLGHHRKSDFNKFEGLKIAWFECSDEKLLRSIEKTLIDVFDPLLNLSNKRKSSNRLTAGTARDFILRVRLTEQEKLLLSAEALSRGVSMSEVVRDYVKSLKRSYE